MIGLLLAAAAPAAGATERVMCRFGDAPRAVPCVFTDRANGAGGHRMVFEGGGRRVLFVGRRNSAWWQGRLNGRPAMAYERDRGHTVFSTTDLTDRFEWWYPGREGGR